MTDSIIFTKNHRVPLSHLDMRYIEQCTDGNELEQIYQELTNESEGSYKTLEQLTLNRLEIFHPTSELIRNKTVINNQTSLKSTDEWRQFQDEVDDEFDSDTDTNERSQLAEQYQLNADQFLKEKNYQQAIVFYTKSLRKQKNPIVYFNRAIAYCGLSSFDAAIRDCTVILSSDSNDVNVLLHRARCYFSKQDYNQAKQDLKTILSIDSENNEAQDLMNTLISQEKSTDNQLKIDVQSPTTINTDDTIDTSMNVDTSSNENHHLSNLESPPPYDQHNFNNFQISSNDDDDEMPLGDEASSGMGDIIQRTNHISRSVDVSPTNVDDLELPKSVNQNLTFYFNKQTNQTHLLAVSDDENDLYDHHTHQKYPSSNMNEFDPIANSNFGFLIQTWLRELSKSHTNRPWSKSPRPYLLDRIQRDIDRFVRFNDYQNAIDVSKKMLRNNQLDYHYHAEYIGETLDICGQCYSKCQDYFHAIEYTSEALEYNRKDDNALIIRGRAFENEKLYMLSYLDYSRVSSTCFKYYEAKTACERLIIELNSLEGETWKEKLPSLSSNCEQFLTYLKLKTNYSDEKAFEWFLTYANQLYSDACFVLAIQFYNCALEIQKENNNEIYLKRAACYLKVFEPQKVINDCENILKIDPSNHLALYYKASAHKMSRDYRLYEYTLREYIKYQPRNQIVLAEYYASRHEQMPRTKRRLRIQSNHELVLSYDELEDIRLNKDFQTNEIKEQCSYILNLQSIESINAKFIESLIYVTRIMIQAEEDYQKSIRPYSYIQYCFNIWLELSTHSEIDLTLSIIDDEYRTQLDDILSYYFLMKFDNVDKLNRLKQL